MHTCLLAVWQARFQLSKSTCLSGDRLTGLGLRKVGGTAKQQTPQSRITEEEEISCGCGGQQDRGLLVEEASSQSIVSMSQEEEDETS